MNYNDLLLEIASIIKTDYSGLKDKANIIAGLNFDHDIENRDEFITFTSGILRKLKDQHFKLLDNKATNYSNGFNTRRYKDTLVITKVINEQELSVGDVITHLDGESIRDLEFKFKDYFYSDDKGRQQWREIIKMSKQATLKDKGVINLEHFEVQHAAPVYSFEERAGLAILTFSDFGDEAAIAAVIEDYAKQARKFDTLVVDVRNNAGGSDLSYLPLLKFLFNDQVMLSELSSDTMATLYSERNCDLRLAMFTEILSNQDQLPQEVKAYIEMEIERYKKYYGAGFVTVEDDFDFFIEGQDIPGRVFILTDQYCGSAGDSFVRLAQLSSKVTCVGRATMGVLDYSNVAFLDLGDDLELMYPTSRMNYLDTTAGIDNVGIRPDIFIEWTPEHLLRDIDFEKVLEVIKES